MTRNVLHPALEKVCDGMELQIWVKLGCINSIWYLPVVDAIHPDASEKSRIDS